MKGKQSIDQFLGAYTTLLIHCQQQLPHPLYIIRKSRELYYTIALKFMKIVRVIITHNKVNSFLCTIFPHKYLYLQYNCDSFNLKEIRSHFKNPWNSTCINFKYQSVMCCILLSKDNFEIWGVKATGCNTTHPIHSTLSRIYISTRGKC